MGGESAFCISDLADLPWSVQDKEVLKRVQRRAGGMVTNLRGRTYEARLREVGGIIRPVELMGVGCWINGQ